MGSLSDLCCTHNTKIVIYLQISPLHMSAFTHPLVHSFSTGYGPCPACYYIQPYQFICPSVSNPLCALITQAHHHVYCLVASTLCYFYQHQKTLGKHPVPQVEWLQLGHL